MAISLFKSFRSTVTPFIPRAWSSALKLLVDPTTGAPTGIQNPNDMGADGVWAPVDVTADQIASPSALMIADLNSTFRLNVAPYTRYQSDGSRVIGLSASNVQGPNGLFGNIIAYAPLTITDPGGLTISGQVRVINFPA